MRYSNGNLLLVRSKWWELAPNALVMEAQALREGVQMAVDIGKMEVIIESDCQVLVKLWDSRKTDRSEVASILKEVEEMSRVFSSFRFLFVPREANVAAHLCAKSATAARPRCAWINTVPSFLASCLQHDCNSAMI